MLSHYFFDAPIVREDCQSSIKLLFARMYCIDKDDFFTDILVKLLPSLKSSLSFENNLREINIEDCLCYCYNICTRAAIQLINLYPADKYLGKP